MTRSQYKFTIQELASIAEQLQKEGWAGTLGAFLDTAVRMQVTEKEIRERLTKSLSLADTLTNRADGSVVVSGAFTVEVMP